VTAKPTVSELGIDLAAQVWHRSGHGTGTIEVAFVRTGNPGVAPDAGDRDRADPRAANRAGWVLMRVAGDLDQRVLVFERHEWECFVDGARNGEFDAAAAPSPLGAMTTRPHMELTAP
jgi:hypothetical protein